MRLGVSAAIVDGVRVDGDIEVDPDDGTVVAVGLRGRGGEGLACPGLVDLQVNGFAGVDFRAAEPEEILDAADALARQGVTSFCPTLHSQSPETYERSLRTIDRARSVQARPVQGRSAKGGGLVGARVLGAHLEGPFLAPDQHGAHDPEHLRPPDPALLDRLLGAGQVAMMTLAPELDGATELVTGLRAAGVVASLGHTAADAWAVRAAVDAGARHVTHLWNAQAAPTARRPGIIGVALTDERLSVGLIVDGRHVSAEILELTLRSCRGRLAATSDAIAEAAAPEGDHHRVDAPSDDTALRGGLVASDACLRNLVGLGLPLAEALDACGGTQRALTGRPVVRCRPGDPADIVVFDDELWPIRTLVGARHVES